MNIQRIAITAPQFFACLAWDAVASPQPQFLKNTTTLPPSI
jgi:hypothetical protein